MDDPALQALYPFLHGGPLDKDKLDRALLDAARAKANDSVEIKRAFFAAHGEDLVAMAHALAGVWRRGGRLFTAGNGGSSCDAAHIAVEFNHPITAGRPALAAVNLTADVAMLTAIGNDIGYEQVFARALLAQACAGDALIVVSTSGNSANLLAALAAARRAGLVTLALSGHDGGAIARSADVDHCLVVASASIHRVQETHVAIYHVLWDLVHTLLAADRGPAR
ncbi:MAG TPA: SIS domain-containing protein [Burkholderiaceae bacterium]|nr:SIS domain-containing protein [Burkholderiaceae bacterium]